MSSCDALNGVRVKDGGVEAKGKGCLWTPGQHLRMLGLMRAVVMSSFRCSPGAFRTRAVAFAWGLGVAATAVLAGTARAQSCTTQAKMTAEQRAQVGAAAYRLGSAVVAGDTNTVQGSTISQYATNFTATANLIHATATHLAGDHVAISEVFLLDATNRKENDTSEAEFSCPLTGTAAEADFSIGGLPPGRYAFAMVEAAGPAPWLLSFLLQEDGSTGWKMAGFYPHPRAVAGHDGLWYWTTARADAKAGKPWLAWVLYGEADELLRPANFASSTNLDRLRTETHSAAPPALSSGLSAGTPLALSGPNGSSYRITGLNSQPSEDGKQLNLIVHLEAEPKADPNAAGARNLAAAEALLSAHPELRSGFDNLWVLAEAPNTNPFVTERPMAEIAAPK